MNEQIIITENEIKEISVKGSNHNMENNNSILNVMVSQINTWYGNIHMCWFDYLEEDDLQKIFMTAGYFYQEKSSFGLLKTEVDLIKIKSSIISLLPGEDSTLLLRTLIFLSGILNIRETVPLLLDVINQKRYDAEELSLIFKSFMIMGIDRTMLQHWLDIAINFNSDNDELKILSASNLTESESLEDFQKAYSILKCIQDDEIKPQKIPLLVVLQSQGIDTTDSLQDILEISVNDDYYNPYKAKWAKAVSSKKVFQAIFDNRVNSELIVEILLQAIADPESWEFIHMIVIEKREEWLVERVSDEITLAYMTLLGIWCESLSEYISDDTCWSKKCGAYLAEIGQQHNRDYIKDYLEETDPEIQYAIKLNILLKKDQISTLDEREFTHRYQTIGYYLPQLTRSILSGQKRLHEFKDIETDFLLSNKLDYVERNKLLKDRTDYVKDLFRTNYEDVFSLNFDNYSNFSTNISLLFLNKESPRVHYEIEDKFYNELDYEKAESLLLLAYVQHLTLKSSEVKAKEKLHLYSERIFNLTWDEFNSLYPLLFREDLCTSYEQAIILASKPSIETNPEIAYLLYRHGKLSNPVKNLLLPEYLTGASDPLCFELDKLRNGSEDTSNLKYIIQSNNSCYSYLSLVFNSIERNLYSKSSAIDILIQSIPRTKDKKEVIDILNKLHLMTSTKDTLHFISQNIFCASDRKNHINVGTAEFMGRNPNKLFIPILMILLKDEYRNVREAAYQSMLILFQETVMTDYINTFSSTQSYSEDWAATLFKDAKSNISDNDEHKEHLKKQFVVELYNDSTDFSNKKYLPRSVWLNILTHFSIDSTDQKNGKVIGHIDENESGEILKWLLEQGDHLFYTVYQE